MDKELSQLSQQAADKHSENKKFLKRLKQKPPKGLDNLIKEVHQIEFERTDCLDCANCCKTTGPLFTPPDIERIAKYLKMSVADFHKAYLRLDEDGDYILQEVPCPFLGVDNHCHIYGVRPKACREYPHTDGRNFHKLGHLTLKNVAICPAAFRIVEEIKQRIGR